MKVATYSPSDLERWVSEAPKDPSRTEFERDRARVLHSAGLRRLGAKTQVLGPESDDFIRTRLTHSLEVAQIGRSLAKNLGSDPDLVETACLCHDLGHPPFGHNGESALAEVAKYIGGFEGNAQTLRLLTRLEAKRFSPAGSVGLNLTRATLDAVLKYPWRAGEGPAGSSSTKFNVYDDDDLVFEWIHGEYGSRMCVEAQLMDLADDIAYSVHDVEDAIARGFLDPGDLHDPSKRAEILEATREWYRLGESDLEGAFSRLLAEESWPESFDGSLRAHAGLKNLTSDIVGRFISGVCEATLKVSGGNGICRYSGSVVIPQDLRDEITVLKGIAVQYVMRPREFEPLYFEQRTMLFDLVDALAEKPEELEVQFRESYREAGEAERLRIVIDQVASLTDQSARQWHAHLCGMLRN